MKQENRINHKWEVFDEKSNMYKCKHCGNFMRRKIFTPHEIASTYREDNHSQYAKNWNWSYVYSMKGSSKWIEEMPKCSQN